MKNQKVIEILVESALFGGLKVDTEGYLEAGAISCWFSWILEEGGLSVRPKNKII